MSGFVLDGLAGRESSMRPYPASALGYERQSLGSNRSGRYCWIGTNPANPVISPAPGGDWAQMRGFVPLRERAHRVDRYRIYTKGSSISVQ